MREFYGQVSPSPNETALIRSSLVGASALGTDSFGVSAGLPETDGPLRVPTEFYDAFTNTRGSG
jgi:hypothetical protein